MGKNQSASGLTNIIQYDNNGNVSFVSGSTTLMQISSSGAITTTGVISGSNALSSSYALNSGLLNGTGSVGFATTASLLTVSSSQQQISSSQQQISASLLNVIAVYATTGSNSFRATQSITGSLTVTGQIIAQTLNVQQVTSSIIYSSGSNNFGCDLNSRQTFTGSVLITGSLTIAGASSATSYSGTTIYGSTAVCSAVGKFTTCIDAGSGNFSGKIFALRNNIGTGTIDDADISLNVSAPSGSGKFIMFGRDAANTAVFTIASSGHLGGPTATFSSTVCALRFIWSSGSTESFLTTGGGNTAIGNGGTAGLTLYSSNNPRLTISATGDSTFTCRVYATGLSTNASLTMDCSAPLSFSGIGGYIYMYSRRAGCSCGAILINNGTGNNLWFGEVGSHVYGFSTGGVGTDYTGTPLLNLDVNTQRVGIGRVSPSAKLEIEIPTTNTQGGCFAASSINLVDPTTVGAYSQITFGYPGGRCWAASYIGHVSTNAYSGGYGDLVFGTRNCGNDIQPTEKLRITSNNSIVGYSQWYTTYTKSLATSDGGTQTARIIEDSLGQWIQVGRFCAPGYTTIAGTWSSVRGLSTSLAQDATTEFSADWGGSKPTEIRIMGATDFCKWRETRTVDFIYRNIPGRPWCVFFNGGSTDGNVIVCGIARYGFNTCGNYDGFGRWNSYDTCMIGIGDGAYTNPSSAYTSPTASVFNWNTTQDAKLSAGHVGGYAGQDSSWTTSFGYDDGVAHFNDVFPNQTSQGGAGVTMTSAVWILLKFN